MITDKKMLIMSICFVIYFATLSGFLIFSENVPFVNSIDFDYGIPTSLNEIIKNCNSNNESIEKVSECFIGYTETFFDYSMDNTRIIRNDDDSFSEKLKVDNTSSQYSPIKDNDILLYLKENSGSCTEWTLYYEELCKMTNFKCESVRNGGISGVFYYHQYLVMYNDDTYCKLDQTKVECKNITVKRNI